MFCSTAQGVQDALELAGKGQGAMIGAVGCRTVSAGVGFTPMEHGRYSAVKGVLDGQLGYVSYFHLYDSEVRMKVGSSSEVRF